MVSCLLGLLFIVYAVEEDNKLVSSDPSAKVCSVILQLKRLSHLPKQVISFLMPEGIVDLFKIVQIQNKQG